MLLHVIFYDICTRMMKLPAKIVVILVFAVSIFHAAASTGSIPVRNFTRQDYGGGTQNWCIVQDSLGRMLVGNREGLLIFDGCRWQKYTLPNFTTVRSVMYDNATGRIYAGGSEEFGYFEPDRVTGILSYHSLIDKFGASHPPFTEIWKIFKKDERVWFQADSHLFSYDGKRLDIITVDGRISHSALINGYIYVGFVDGRLKRVETGDLAELAGAQPLANNKIVSILPFGNSGGLLVGTSINGLYISRRHDDPFVPLTNDINDFLINNQMFCGASNGDVYIFGTVNDGAVIHDIKTGDTNYINRNSGMQNNTVLVASFDMSGNIWLGLDNGIDYANYNSPVTNLIGINDEAGAGYTSILRDGRLYLGTNQGLYSLPYPTAASPQPLSLKHELQGQIWSVTDGDDTFFVAADAGVYYRQGDRFVHVDNVPGAHKVILLKNRPGLALASTYTGFYLLERTGNTWQSLGRVRGYDDIGGDVVEAPGGDLWLAHWRKGVYRLVLNADEGRFTLCRLYTQREGLPDNHDNRVLVYDGRPVFTGRNGFYTLDDATDSIVADGRLNHMLGTGRSGMLFYLAPGLLTFLPDNGPEIIRVQHDGSALIDTLSFKHLSHRSIPGYVHFNYISPHEVVMSTQEGFVNLDIDRAVAHDRSLGPFISLVYANRDSLVYSAAPGVEPKLTLPCTLNSLRFDFALPDYNSTGVIEFSTYLENYDKDWSPYSTESSVDFTQLSEGTYTLHLRARDANTNALYETDFSVTILPPWFRTTLAKCIYLLLLTIVLFVTVLFIRRWNHNTRRRIEARQEQEMAELRRRSEQEALVKDYEIATLKSEQLEQDIKHKSGQLSSTTMNLIRKNEILNDIAGKISKIQSVTSTLPGAHEAHMMLARIQSSIAENISHDDDWNTFTRNFDVVYQNFNRRLDELHPNLSPADKRICCYIKMGLSSKDIAPLVNISYKSVEMARYRMRKKIGLDPEMSLTDYLARL